jgi:hypothetical protein
MLNIVEVKNWDALATEVRRCEEAGPKIFRGVTNFERHKVTTQVEIEAGMG